MPSGPFKEYDSNEVSIVFGVINIDGGYGDDEFCRIARKTEAFTDVVGTDGSVTRSKTLDKRAEVEITLMQSSDINDQLSAQLILDEGASGGAGVVPLMIRDKGGRALHHAENAWISKPPERVFKRGAEGRKWTITCASMDSFDGGN